LRIDAFVDPPVDPPVDPLVGFLVGLFWQHRSRGWLRKALRDARPGAQLSS